MITQRARALFACGLAASTAGAMTLYLRAVERDRRGGAPVAVLVARASLAQGARLAADSAAIRQVPSGYVHPEAVRADAAKEFVGRPLVNALAAGQPILATDFTLRQHAGDRPLGTVMPRGLRALTVPVDASSSVGGLLRPSDRVDVLGTFARDGRTDRATMTLLQNVTVLATGTRLEPPGGDAGAALGRAPGGASYAHITLAVDLEEAELLAFASTRGTLHVVLRHEEDARIVEDVPEKSMADLFEPERRTALIRRHRTIEALRPQAVRR